MSVTDSLRAEKLVAKRYEDQGYTVTFEPSQSDIPFPLQGYRPDILATKGSERLLVEVKRAGTRFDTSRYVSIGEEAARHGWKFMLVTVTPEQLNPPTEAPAALPEVEAIRERLQEIDHVHNAIRNPALVLPALWVAYVSALKSVCLKENIRLGEVTDLSLINKAYSEGVLSIDEYESARTLLKLRNEAVHSVTSVMSDAQYALLREMLSGLLAKL
ncbi:hypothetical protein [Burkholderia sp. MSMB1835]|uniref:hypothetical protein n=1 Tax=Burkholderia sp. MSMB1835 TaxID=1637876 RepID=UPI000753780C|nr:hypothetical protein [Burkholderia sp. MSMB1835]KVL40981.1 hypothetical protein WS96_02895 [Burkholderia sp. MSMB1835]